MFSGSSPRFGAATPVFRRGSWAFLIVPTRRDGPFSPVSSRCQNTSWYPWHAPDGQRAIAAPALGCMQAGATKLGVIGANCASAIIGVLGSPSSHWKKTNFMGDRRSVARSGHGVSPQESRCQGRHGTGGVGCRPRRSLPSSTCVSGIDVSRPLCRAGGPCSACRLFISPVRSWGFHRMDRSHRRCRLCRA